MTPERILNIVNLLLPVGMSAFIRIKNQDGQVIAEKDLYAQTDDNFQQVIDAAGGDPT